MPVAGRTAVPASDPHAGLLPAIAARDEAALSELYSATSRRVYGLALKLVRDPATAEEITLTVFTEAWNQAATFDSARSSVLSWLLMMTRSRAIDALRRRQRREGHEESIDAALSYEARQPGPEEEAAQGERARQVRRALATLPLEQRTLIEAAYFYGLTHVEIAEAFDQPLGTVKTRIRRGMHALRDELAEARDAIP